MNEVVVLTTVGADFDAAALAKSFVDDRLAACVNILPQVRSIYRWKDKVEDEAEQLLLIKTTDAKVPALRDALFDRHPYDVPEFVVIAMDRVEGPYREWLLGSL
jgi:periplasmic divalent cation tolerance protein